MFIYSPRSANAVAKESGVSREWREEEVSGWANDSDNSVESVVWLDLDLTVAGKQALSGLEGLRIDDSW